MTLIKFLLLAMCLSVFAACGGGGGGSGEVATPPVIDPPVVDATAPVVTITAPLANAKVTGFTTIAANASDNVGVVRVDFLVNGVQIASDAVAPYAYNWSAFSLAAGSYTLSARAYDAANNYQSSNVVITVPAITTAMTAIPSGTTAAGTVAVHGIAAPDAYGFDFTVTMPPGARIASVASSGIYAATGITFNSGPDAVTHVNSNVGTGEIMVINFADVPAGATAASFSISLSAAFDGAGVQIQ